MTRRGEIEIANGFAAILCGSSLVLDGDILRLTPGLADLADVAPSWVWGALFLVWALLIYLAWYCRAWKCQRAGLFLGTMVWSGLATKMWIGLGYVELHILIFIALAAGCMAAYLRLRFRPDARNDALA